MLDVETGAPVEARVGSVCWNEHRRRWVMIAAGQPGEIWFSEADTPTGPWAYARRVAAHGRYNFYNPTQHPFFDQDAGRVIYFEGTYTDSFSGAPAKTPRYDYNQLMYPLAFDDERLHLPQPVYRVKRADAPSRLWMREGVEAEQAWGRIEEISFLALPTGSRRKGLVPIYAGDVQGGTRLQTNAPTRGSQPLFFALPAHGALEPAPESSNPSAAQADSSIVPLFKYTGPATAAPLYSVKPDLAGASQPGAPVCRVWKSATLQPPRD